MGKFTMIHRFIKGSFLNNKVVSTVSVNYQNKKIKIDTYTELNMQIWDTVGQER